MILLLLFQLKHFICDYPLQISPYQYLNKGTYGHLGGLLHALIHSIGTFVVLVFFVAPIGALMLCLLDGITHYHIDWAKVKLTQHYGLTPSTSAMYWLLLGFDQLLHQLTYLGIIWLIIN